MDELKKGTEQFELFRWFVQQTAIRSTAGRDDPATYAILLFLAHFHRDEIRAFWDRLILARDKAQCHDYDIAGSLRRENEYAIFFVAAPPMQALPMEYLLEKARKKCDPKVLLQVYANFHETYGFSWIVTDIDPTYTMGDMARKRQEIIRVLKEEGVKATFFVI